MESSSEEKITPKRAPRKRAVTGAAKPVPKTTRAPRRVATATAKKKVAPSETIAEKDIRSDRKAPTPLAAKQTAKNLKQKQLIIVGVILLVGISTSAVVGYTDKGQIDVQRATEERNERIRTNNPDERDTLTSQLEVPVQNTNVNGKPNGGLVGRGTGGRPKVVVDEQATSTATTTDQMASSTEAIASSTEPTNTEDILSEEN